MSPDVMEILDAKVAVCSKPIVMVFWAIFIIEVADNIEVVGLCCRNTFSPGL